MSDMNMPSGGFFQTNVLKPHMAGPDAWEVLQLEHEQVIPESCCSLMANPPELQEMNLPEQGLRDQRKQVRVEKGAFLDRPDQRD